MTITGIGLILTVIVNRRKALTISGLILWGLAIFNLLISIKWVKSGNPGNSMTAVMFYSIIGATLIISQNYEYIMKFVQTMFSKSTNLRAISQVTTRGMIGRKTRGVLVFTIFSIILTLNVFIISTSHSLKIGMVQDYDWRSDGVDVVVNIETPVPGVADAIQTSDPSIEEVFAFRRTWVPTYLEDISVDNLKTDPDEVLSWRPLIEIPREMIDRDDWGDDSLKLSFEDAISGNKEGSMISSSLKIGGSPSEEHESASEIFDNFFNGQARDITRTYDLDSGSQIDIKETQIATIGGMFTAPQFDALMGTSMYLETKNGSVLPTYIGASTSFDMVGIGDFFGWGFLITPEIAQLLPEFDDIRDPNVFLVRSNNNFNDDENNDQLASTIEKVLNDIDDQNSLSSQLNVFIGATTQVIKDVASEFWSREANFWDFLAVFSSLGLIIGTIGMSIIAVRSVSERIREIGMMRSIGFSPISVVQGVIIELVVLSILGLIVGVLNGVLFTIAIVQNLFEIEPIYPFTTLIFYVSGVIVISVIAGILPSYNASKIRPSEALRYTG
jgi:ABC-type antimicrobial peptide transport system permease subunit